MNKIEQLISDQIFEVTNIRVDDRNINLLSGKLNIYYGYYLNVFEELERIFSIPVFRIFETLKYYEFTIKDIAREIEILMYV